MTHSGSSAGPWRKKREGLGVVLLRTAACIGLLWLLLAASHLRGERSPREAVGDLPTLLFATWQSWPIFLMASAGVAWYRNRRAARNSEPS